MSSEKSTIISNIRDRMDELELNIAQVAKLANIQRVGLSRILSGKTEPRNDTLAKIARALRTTSNELRNERGSKEAFKASSPEIKRSLRHALHETSVDFAYEGTEGMLSKNLMVQEAFEAATKILLKLREKESEIESYAYQAPFPQKKFLKANKELDLLHRDFVYQRLRAERMMLESREESLKGKPDPYGDVKKSELLSLIEGFDNDQIDDLLVSARALVGESASDQSELTSKRRPK